MPRHSLKKTPNDGGFFDATISRTAIILVKVGTQRNSPTDTRLSRKCVSRDWVGRPAFPCPRKIVLHREICVTMAVRGIRGATAVNADEPPQILQATRVLLEEMLRANGIVDFSEIVSIIFTTTSDLTSTFPAEAARELGMIEVPLLCASEIPVPKSLARCIRVLMHVNSETPQSQIHHIYQNEAKRLRPDVE